jgi:N-acetylglucosaminyldiphosphoundecaprenol N-acetyl-beta-D-mannosaminyltransferase
MTPSILGMRVDATSYEEAARQVVEWALASESRTVCAANVHMVMEAWDSPEFRRAVNGADLVTPDGMPLAWMMRLKGQRGQTRVYGPTLMLRVLDLSERENIPVGFYGSSPKVLETLVARMQAQRPALNVAFVHSPPFRAMSQQEDEEIVRQINASGARILFVALGCPAQEKWMAAQRGKVQAVMLGVGAAFDFHAGTKPQAPPWMQRLGLEWLFRLFQEPGRLWKRYLYHNPRFVILALRELLQRKS